MPDNPSPNYRFHSRRELSPKSCPLTSLNVQHMCSFLHSHMHFKKGERFFFYLFSLLSSVFFTYSVEYSNNLTQLVLAWTTFFRTWNIQKHNIDPICHFCMYIHEKVHVHTYQPSPSTWLGLCFLHSMCQASWPVSFRDSAVSATHLATGQESYWHMLPYLTFTWVLVSQT